MPLMTDGPEKPDEPVQPMAAKPAEPDNDLLKANEDAIEARLDPAARRDYQRIVLAGMKSAMANNGALLRNLPQSKDPVKDCAIGAVNLTFLMIKTQNVPFTERLATAATMAAYTLTLQALDMANKMGLVEITPEVVAQATTIATDRIFQAMHLTPQMMAHAAAKVHAITQDPKAMEQIELKIGAKRDPRAAVETPGLEQPAMQEAPDAAAS